MKLASAKIHLLNEELIDNTNHKYSVIREIIFVIRINNSFVTDYDIIVIQTILDSLGKPDQKCSVSEFFHSSIGTSVLTAELRTHNASLTDSLFN